MSDLDHLDRAFEALTRDLAHSPGPGAAAAMSTVRRRRRTRVGAVALATLVVVGGGLGVPRLVFPDGGVAANGGSARLDTAALAAATEGWIGDWETWERNSPWGGGSFSVASCSSVDGPGGEPMPEPTSRGSSRFVSHSGASAVLVIGRYAGTGVATPGVGAGAGGPDACVSTTTYNVDGVQVRHDSMPPDPEADADMWLGDVWIAQLGADLAVLEVVNDTGVADEATAEEVAEALVAGLRDGWTQSGMENVGPALPQAAQLPPFPNDDLDQALVGWHAASITSASSEPNTPCLGLSVSTGSITSSGSGTPLGVTYELAGYEEEDAGAKRVATMVEEIRTCQDLSMEVEELPNGVFLVTYDDGTPDGRGALWLAAHGDRAGVIGVDGADRPMPMGVGADVADVLYTWLRLPWE